MNDYSRGDVEFLAMEIFHRDHGDNRSWETWDGTPSRTDYRARAKALLEEPADPVIAAVMEPVPQSPEGPVVAGKRAPRKSAKV